MRFIFLLLLLLCSPVFADIQMDEGTPNKVLAVQALIERFDNTETIVRTEPWLNTLPVFVVYAKAVASFGDCAVDPLIIALENENPQVRVAAAIALDEIGSASIKAKPLLEEMLQSEDDRTVIMACCIIRGIGPDAVELVELVMTCLDHDNFHVQYWACRALSAVGPNATPAVEMLCESLENGIGSVRRNAAIALGNIAGSLDRKSLFAVILALEVATEDRCYPVRVAAKEALVKIKPVC